MALERDNGVPSISNSSCDNYDDDDNKSSIVSKLVLKCKSLLSKKKHYKHELSNLSKEFESLKKDFSRLVESNEKLSNNFKSSNELEDQLKKANDENLKLSKQVLELKNFIDKLMKGKRDFE